MPFVLFILQFLTSLVSHQLPPAVCNSSFVSCVWCGVVQVFDKNNGSFVRQFGSVGSKEGQLQYPDGIAVDGPSVIVVDQSNHRLQVGVHGKRA
jgi:hypothetical protein